MTVAATRDKDAASRPVRDPTPDFKRRILEAFNEGNCGRPSTTFSNVNSDVLEHFSPGLIPTDFVDLINGSAWPE